MHQTKIATVAVLGLLSALVATGDVLADGPKTSTSQTKKYPATGGVIPTKKTGTGGLPSPTMYCRGPFAVGTAGGYTVIGKGVTTAAGSMGNSLAPGKCSWVDRGVGSGELTIELPIGYAPALSIVTTCAGDSDCILKFAFVEKAEGSSRWFNANPSGVTRFPRGF